MELVTVIQSIPELINAALNAGLTVVLISMLVAAVVMVASDVVR